ncbi:hypothetical protein Brsp07_03013 [Brucella sp. NBRC 14130]|uniref:hypothetical protein n=1 Tax=Brucella sp. NBRC 14130 TaxID=3075483 RepID=UPI0030AE3B6D
MKVASDDNLQYLRWRNIVSRHSCERIRIKRQQPQRIFHGERRKHIVSKVFDALSDWRYSPFQREGELRAALRSTLCLTRARWADADYEAASLISEGLKLIGAVRPDWIEGQPDYAIRGDLCSWCRRPLSDLSQVGGRTRHYCSVECAQAAFQGKAFQRRDQSDEAYRTAHKVIVAARLGSRECVECGKSFVPIGKRIDQKYCSTACHGKSRIVIEKRSCVQCGKLFTPHNRQGTYRYCSTECYHAFRSADAKARRITKTCLCCGETFVPQRPTTMFCSKVCVGQSQRKPRIIPPPLRLVPTMRSAIIVPLTPIIFDEVFKQAA